MLEIVLTNKNEIMTTATVQTTNIILYGHVNLKVRK